MPLDLIELFGCIRLKQVGFGKLLWRMLRNGIQILAYTVDLFEIQSPPVPAPRLFGPIVDNKVTNAFPQIGDAFARPSLAPSYTRCPRELPKQLGLPSMVRVLAGEDRESATEGTANLPPYADTGSKQTSEKVVRLLSLSLLRYIRHNVTLALGHRFYQSIRQDVKQFYAKVW